MSNSIPIYFVSCFDKNDYHKNQTLTKIKSKISRLEKAFVNTINLFRHPNLDIKEAHQTLLTSLITSKKPNSRYVVILEDETTIIDIPRFRDLIKNNNSNGASNHFPEGKILHLGGYLEEKSEGNIKKWIKGHSRNHFAYMIDLEKFDLDSLKELKNCKTKEEFEQFIYSISSFMLSPILVTPFGYDLQKGKMEMTHKGLSIGQFDESNQNQLTLKLNSIPDVKLPRITLITIINNQRLWWPLIRLNLDNFSYPTHKMKWIIVETTDKNGYTIEDVLPKTRGKPGAWELDYIKYEKEVKEEKYKKNDEDDFISIVKYLENEGKLSGDFAVEFDPQHFYPTFTLMSRVKTLLQYSNIKIAGTTKTQLYSIKNDYTTLIGNEEDLELLKGSRIVRLKQDYNYTFNTIMRIPYQFTNYCITSKPLESIQIRYSEIDSFPEFIEKEEYFPELILFFEDLKTKLKIN